MLIVQGLFGMIAILFVGYLLSSDRGAINWRAVGGAFAIQLTLGALVLYFPPGKLALEAVAAVVISILGYAQSGMDFLFGQFASGNNCLLYTSPSPRDKRQSRMPSSA